jgi:folate-binding protein YgfZ
VSDGRDVAVAGYDVLRGDVGAVWLDRDFVSVAGPDAESFLQGQLSQDVAGMTPGERRWSWLLQPQGKVDALLRVTRAGDDAFVLDTDAGWGDAVVARLNRFRLRVKVDVGAVAGWRCLTVRGPKAAGDEPWPGLPGHDLLGDAVELPDGVPLVDGRVWDVVRIEAGIPRMGVELTDATIPAEAGQWLVDRTVSFTKGCFTGQELVARIDSRGGHVPRHLRGVVIDADAAPSGAAIEVDRKVVGSVTSAAWSPGLRAAVALAYVGRAVTPPASAVVTWDGGSAPARIASLPLVS